MVRQIVNIDKEKCTGCGLCASACHENAIGMVDGKATLLRDDYCDGMGDCLPECPAGAISFEMREADAYDEAAVLENKKKLAAGKEETAKAVKTEEKKSDALAAATQAAEALKKTADPEKAAQAMAKGGCPGSRMRVLKVADDAADQTGQAPLQFAGFAKPVSQLRNWPVQIKLAPTKAQYFQGAKLLIAADCTAYAYANFHEDFIKGKVTLIGCPKLDNVDYSEKLTRIIADNDIKSVTVVRMEVPCCGGLERAAIKALQQSGKFIPWQVVTISYEGKILDR